jgi:flagellar hook-associated protein 1 FlgK
VSDLLSIGSSGLAAYRNALNAVGENVANADTPGYARRTVQLQEVNTTGNTPFYKSQIIFGGVETVGVQRAWDQFKAAEARTASAAAGRADTRQQWLGAVESALDDGPTGVGSSLTNFFAAATTLAGDPGDPLNRSAMLTSLEDVTRSFRSTADALTRVSGGIADAAKLDVDSVNNTLAALYNLNGTIRAAAAGSTARASLEDQRDLLIDQLSAKLDVTATINGDGTVNLTSTGASAVSLLQGTGPGFITLSQATDGRLALNLAINGTTTPLPAASGALSGYLDAASQTADRRAQLDALGADFVAAINDWQAGGLDADGNPGADLLSQSGGASTMQPAVTDPDLIAAAGTDGTPNGNLIALDGIRASADLEGRWGAIVSQNAQVLASAKSEASAAESWRDYSKAALDGVSGIDLDREAADLLRYQQAYSASARIIQVARETVQSLFDALR